MQDRIIAILGIAGVGTVMAALLFAETASLFQTIMLIAGLIMTAVFILLENRRHGKPHQPHGSRRTDPRER